MTMPQRTMITGMKMDGRKRLSRICVKGSNPAYEMKKIVKVKLYCELVNFRSVLRPAILALPMLVRSRKDAR
jgi:hypothetical protein